MDMAVADVKVQVRRARQERDQAQNESKRETREKKIVPKSWRLL